MKSIKNQKTFHFKKFKKVKIDQKWLFCII